MKLTAETLEERLNDLAEEASRSGGQFDKTERTRKVEQLLTKLGKDMGHRVAVKGGCNWGKGEWMYDVVWADLIEDELIHTIPLVAECEWGETEQHVWDDFQKLLIGRAERRVMIFRANSRSKALSLVEDLKKQIKCFKSSQDGDTYLFASYVEEENPPFSVKEYVFRKNS